MTTSGTVGLRLPHFHPLPGIQTARMAKTPVSLQVNFKAKKILIMPQTQKIIVANSVTLCAYNHKKMRERRFLKNKTHVSNQTRHGELVKERHYSPEYFIINQIIY